MHENERQKTTSKRLSITFIILILCLILTVLFIINQAVGLNDSVEYERSVFISQIAEQMKKNLIISTENHQQSIRILAQVLDEVRPSTFEQVSALFPEYASSETPDWLFFLSTDHELYGIDGVKQWASLPYDTYFMDILNDDQSANFIRIGMRQEFMVYAAPLSLPIDIDGHEIAAVMFGWDSSEYRATLSSKLFEENSSSLLVGSNGNIAIYPEDMGSESYGYNVLTYLKRRGMDEHDLQALQELLAGTGDQTLLCTVDGRRWLFNISYYNEQFRIFIMLPIQNTSIRTYQNLYNLIGGMIASFIILFVIVGITLVLAYLRKKEQQEKALQTELLMKSAQAKNDFLAKMSHDIRTPLNGIIGMNYIASINAPPECTAVRDNLKKVDTAAKYLLGILNDILDMSKIESGALGLAHRPFSLETLRDGLESLMAFQTVGREFSFIVDAPPPLDYDYIGDELRLKQMLINLLSNAAKFTEKGSITLTIKVRPVSDETDEVTFKVRDTGKGMSKEFLSQLFTPFVQEDENITTKYGGSGLGLAIVKSYVDMMGGTISVESEPNKGTEFTVSIIFTKTSHALPENTATTSEPSAVSYAGKRALLCEDNDLNAEIAQIILENQGLVVERAENGEVGVAKYLCSAVGYFDIIFMDVRMPQMDGYEATRIIRASARPDAQEIPICALSANAFADDIKQSMEAGMNEHLSKPLDVNRLLEVLNKYIESGGNVS